MRKSNSIFCMAVAFLVFALFAGSGCGGSAGSSDSDEDSTAYHETITTFLTGEWKLDSVPSATANTADEATLSNFENFKLSFNNIEFGSDSQKSSGSFGRLNKILRNSS